MHYAVLYERISLVEVYLSAMDFKIDDVDRNGNSVLHYSAACGNGQLTSLLLNAYVQYEINPNKVNSSGNTSLIVACKMGQKACASILAACEAVDSSVCDKGGRSGDEWFQMVSNEESDDEETQSQLERQNSVSSIRSLSTLSGCATGLAVGGRHSRLGMYTPLGGSRHYNRQYKRVRREGGGMQRSVSRLSACEQPERGLTDKRSNDNEAKMVRFSDSTEQIHNILNNRHNQQIRSASPADFRNQAQCVFHVSPFDCFNPSNIPRTSSAFMPPSPVTSNVRQVAAHRTQEHHPFKLHSWRGQFKQLFDTFNFQFSPSFRKGVPPQEDIEPPSCDTPSIRPPSGSTRVSDVDSETASQVSKPRSAGRRQSIAIKAGIVGTLQVAGDQNKTRRPSISSNVSSLSGKQNKKNTNNTMKHVSE